VTGAGLQVALEGKGGGFGVEGNAALQAPRTVSGGEGSAAGVVIEDALAKVTELPDTTAALVGNPKNSKIERET
jgi:hypothetical protein